MQPNTQRKIPNAKEWLKEGRNIKEAIKSVRECHETMLNIMPWFGLRVAKAKVNIDPSVKTAATDGKNIVINPLMVALLSMAEIIFVLAHEVLHIALNHHTRRGDRDPVLWNMAGDFIINALLRKAGLKMPEAVLYDQRFDDMTTEQVYDILKEEKEKGEGEGEEGEGEGEEGEEGEGEGEEGEEEGEGTMVNPGERNDAKGKGNGGQGKEEDNGEGEKEEEPEGLDEEGTYQLPKPDEWADVNDAINDDGDELNDDERKEEEQKVIEDNAMSERFEKQVGAEGSGLFADALSQELNQSKHNWKKELRRFMTDAHRRGEERTWNRINRRAISRGVIEQGFDREGHGEIVIAGDASGSVSTDEFEIALAQVGTIINSLRPEKTHWIQFDGDVLSHDVFKRGARFKDPKRSGYGATSFRPVLERIKSKRLIEDGEDLTVRKPTCIIVLTDMGIYDWSYLEDPKVPVLWVDVSEWGCACGVKWGKTIKVRA
jgi:predicted metal-dependent peptidase